MKKYSIIIFSAFVLVILAGGLLYLHFNNIHPEEFAFWENEGEKEEEGGTTPSDWFIWQRAYPETSINYSAYRTALVQAKRRFAEAYPTDEAVWVPAGPDNIGGRITALGVHPSNPNTIYAGAADGGVLKSIDGGITWTSIFDQSGALSIGAIAVDPNDSNVVWVGTGEANASGDSYPGDGIYRSADGGMNWEHLGLDSSYHIGRIAIDPLNTQRVFVAVMGALFAGNPDRGVYLSTDGGATWNRKLYITDSTACVDIVINPQNPQIVYSAMWERIRHPWARNVGGITSGIWRSVNGGENWTQLTNGLPPNAPDIGRIGLSISPNYSNILFALYFDDPGEVIGIWKTQDGGDTWVETNHPSSNGLSGGFGWYFGNIMIDPVDPRKVYALGVNLYRSLNSGTNWSNISGDTHVDHHAFWINPNNTNQIIDGNDGGVYYTTDGAENWTKCFNLHITQFYDIEIDYNNPQRLYGGTQDNGTLRTLTGGLSDWDWIYWGDGFYTIVDYTNPQIIYAEYQWGNLAKSIDGGNNFEPCLNGIDEEDRRNWNTPVVMSPNDHNTLYYGTYRLYRTVNGAGAWLPVSDDLTAGIPTGYTFHTITTIAVAPTNDSVIYVGTDDGNVWVTWDYCTAWTQIDSGLPERWVTRVAVSPQNAGIVYVTVSGYRYNEYLPHVFRSIDYGSNWQDISGDLPEAPANAIIEDPEQPERLFLGTDVGVFYTENLGLNWEVLGSGLPICVIMDLKLHNPSRTLVAGTHGRSMYKMSLDSLTTAITSMTVNNTANNFFLYPPYPNPFNQEAVIRFSLLQAGKVELSVFDIQGRIIRTLAKGDFPAGMNTIKYSGEGLSSGIFLVKLKYREFQKTEKLLLLK